MNWSLFKLNTWFFYIDSLGAQQMAAYTGLVPKIELRDLKRKWFAKCRCLREWKWTTSVRKFEKKNRLSFSLIRPSNECSLIKFYTSLSQFYEHRKQFPRQNLRRKRIPSNFFHLLTPIYSSCPAPLPLEVRQQTKLFAYAPKYFPATFKQLATKVKSIQSASSPQTSSWNLLKYDQPKRGNGPEKWAVDSENLFQLLQPVELDAKRKLLGPTQRILLISIK